MADVAGAATWTAELSGRVVGPVDLGNDRFQELIAEAGPGIEAAHASRGCAFGDFDFDNDDDMDIFIVNMRSQGSW